MASHPDVVPIFLEVPRPEIAYVKFLFESYEGVAVVRTIDRQRAVLVVLAAPDLADVARDVVRTLTAEGACRELTPDVPLPDLLGDPPGPDEPD